MKSILITTLFTLLSFIGFSQNGGQFDENDYGKLTLMGYSNGQFLFKLVNKQPCEVTFRNRFNQEPSFNTTINGNDSTVIYVTKPQNTEVKFTAKPENMCNNQNSGDMGRLEIGPITLTSLSLVENNYIKVIRNDYVFDLKLLSNKILIRSTQKNERVTIVIRNITGYTYYTNKISFNGDIQFDLQPYLRKGINLITILFDNKHKDIYTFKNYNE